MGCSASSKAKDSLQSARKQNEPKTVGAKAQISAGEERREFHDVGAKTEKEQWTEVVRRNGDLKSVPELLRNDRELVIAAVTKKGSALQFVSADLKNDKEVVLTAVKQSGPALKYAAEDLRKDKEVVMAAVRQNGYALEFAVEELKNCKDFVLAVMKLNGKALQYTKEKFKGDWEVAMAAVENSGTAIKYASEKLKKEKELALAAVTQNGNSLEYVCTELRHRDVAMIAVQQRGYALKFVPDDLKNDPELVLAALKSDGTAWQFASRNIRKDQEFLVRAVEATKASWLLKLCTKELQSNSMLIRQVAQAAGTGLVFSYYNNYNCSVNMRDAFVATGASVPGGPAYEKVMQVLSKTEGSTATVWFDETPVFGFSADSGKWIHPSHECGRDYVPVPAVEGRHPMWDSMVESRTKRLSAEVGSTHPCWCCHWLREVMRRHQEGAVICCAVSNIYHADWVEEFGAGSSELSDLAAEKFDLKPERFRNGRTVLG
ncbi:Uncharacterized protein SCF082_LOCUS31727 [Durusdinium trenchii]|uniref:DUF4116 domain-containing protein n=1 Tax=Durusdinium trenchii TaxID=1381693 RepID=A0ABP0N8M4_9DINO